MPYFVFKIYASDKLELVEDYAVFKEAMQRCREMRAALPTEAEYSVRMIFANDAEEGRRLLRTQRGAPPLEEWEA